MSPDPRTSSAITQIVRQKLEFGAPLVLGLCGAQGSGKSTLAAALARQFEVDGVPTAILSLDDLYKTRAERDMLAKTVHPLLRTRGAPGTHDVGLGLNVLAAIDAARPTSLPRFDKGRDDRAPQAVWPTTSPDLRLLIFEGWCVGAQAELAEALVSPVNALEAEEDPGGVWRRYVNDALAGDYQRLFARIDILILLAEPDFEQVLAWRSEQERELIERTGHGMAPDELVRFVRHYERLSRHIQREMPSRADMVIRLAEDRSPVEISKLARS